jgi:hypothetical protein
MNLELTDEQSEALVRELSRVKRRLCCEFNAARRKAVHS